VRASPPSRVTALTHLLASLRVIAAVSRSPSLRRVELAFFLFNAAEFGTWVAILLYAYEATGPASIGVVAIAQLIPAALSAPFAALLADRPQRTHALAAGYVLQALTFGMTAAFMILGVPPLVVYVSAAIAACSTVFTRPTQGALLPELSRTPEELSVANGVSGTVEGAGLFIGPLAAAAILTVGPPGAVFVAGTVAYLVAASLVVSLPPTAHPIAVEAGESSDPTATSSRTSEPLHVLDGIRVLRENGGVRLVVTLLALRGVVIGALDVLFILLALEVYETGEPGAGILTGALGVGTMLGGAAAFSLVGRRRLAPALAFAVCVCGIALVSTAAIGTGTTAPFLVAVAGIGSAAADVAGRTILQRTAPDAVLGRVLGSLDGFSLFGMALGSVLVPILAISVGIVWALALTGALLPFAVLLGWRGLRGIDRRTRVPERELAVIGRNRVFAPLAPPALETVARKARWWAIDPGHAAIRQGGRGDAYYVIEHGRFQVDVDGRPTRILDSPSDGFGEIALLRDVPRTATVTAIDAAVLLVVRREDFLAAVAGATPARDAAERLVTERV
jgi:MFS family permease